MIPLSGLRTHSRGTRCPVSRGLRARRPVGAALQRQGPHRLAPGQRHRAVHRRGRRHRRHHRGRLAQQLPRHREDLPGLHLRVRGEAGRRAVEQRRPVPQREPARRPERPRPRLPARDRSVRARVDGRHLRRGAPRLALPGRPQPAGQDGLPVRALEPAAHRGDRPLAPHVGQRRPGGPRDRRPRAARASSRCRSTRSARRRGRRPARSCSATSASRRPTCGPRRSTTCSSATRCPTTSATPNGPRAGACSGTARRPKGWRGAQKDGVPGARVEDRERRAGRARVRRRRGATRRRHRDAGGVRGLRAPARLQADAGRQQRHQVLRHREDRRRRRLGHRARVPAARRREAPRREARASPATGPSPRSTTSSRAGPCPADWPSCRRSASGSTPASSSTRTTAWSTG